MGQITIRKLDDDVIRTLKQRAAAAGHSMEEEARRTLVRSVTSEVDRVALVQRMEALAARIGSREGQPDTAELVRQSREERDQQLDKAIFGDGRRRRLQHRP